MGAAREREARYGLRRLAYLKLRHYRLIQTEPLPVLGVRCRWLIPGDILRWLTADRSDRESLWAFCSGLPWLAEEWDSKDLRGLFSCILCQALAVLRPKYRNFLRR